jgi:hypothetical protein
MASTQQTPLLPPFSPFQNAADIDAFGEVFKGSLGEPASPLPEADLDSRPRDGCFSPVRSYSQHWDRHQSYWDLSPTDTVETPSVSACASPELEKEDLHKEGAKVAGEMADATMELLTAEEELALAFLDLESQDLDLPQEPAHAAMDLDQDQDLPDDYPSPLEFQLTTYAYRTDWVSLQPVRGYFNGNIKPDDVKVLGSFKSVGAFKMLAQKTAEKGFLGAFMGVVVVPSHPEMTYAFKESFKIQKSLIFEEFDLARVKSDGPNVLVMGLSLRDNARPNKCIHVEPPRKYPNFGCSYDLHFVYMNPVDARSGAITTTIKKNVCFVSNGKKSSAFDYEVAQKKKDEAALVALKLKKARQAADQEEDEEEEEEEEKKREEEDERRLAKRARRQYEQEEEEEEEEEEERPLKRRRHGDKD